ncbi:hypothetical protein J437_LFUL013598 [Ladona fulva]|uniref:Uncharacterized protein n=1 Tax=Ladona fulva TaxID=123851 RepID=A0A8K0KDP2_LADFU|nr:hypothetical protein J437_LFUL013598 [Ladona fulva]
MRTCLGGQSLPNLSSVGGGRASGSTQHHHHPSTSSMFLVPPSRSPPPPPIGVNQRGISYPPPSPPRSLRRAYAVVAPQSFRNPPLTKTRHVGSVGPPSFSIGINADTGSQGISSEEGGDGRSLPISLDIDVPVIRSVQTPSVGGNPSLQSQEREDSGVGCGDGAEGTSQNLERQEMLENTRKTPSDTQTAYEMPTNSRQGLVKRLGRGGERQDNRRYHTAGAIDDIKKQDGRDTVIHKRLSWNCGSNDQPTNVSQETNQLDNPPPFLVSSFESVQSSSGVSSARSSNVHLPADEEESTADDRWANPGMFSPSTIGGAFLKVLTPEFFRDITSSQKCPSPSRSKAIEDDPWVDDASGEILPPVEAVNEQVSTLFVLQIPILHVVHMASGGEGSSEMGAEGTAQGGASSRPSKADLLRMKDFILTDSSIEASDV